MRHYLSLNIHELLMLLSLLLFLVDVGDNVAVAVLVDVSADVVLFLLML